MADIDPLKLVEPAATRVRDPVSGRSVWLAGLLKDPKLTAGGLQIGVAYDEDHTSDDRKSIEDAIRANLVGLGYDGKVLFLPTGATPQAQQPAPPKKDAVPGMSGPGMGPHGGPIQKQKLPGVKHIVAVASGKGGVGKSTVSVNLAIALQKLGYTVGILDADVHGPSVPRMMNVQSRPIVDPDKRIVPVNSYGVRCISMGMLVDEAEAMIWRGPMVMSAVRQFLQQTRWNGTDYLIVDLPPGTGDAQLTLIQAVEIAGAVIVTTPQDVALGDAIRGITMFQKLDVPLLGLVENMAYYQLPDGTKDFVFGEGGGLRIAERYGTDVLAQIPLRTNIRKGGDQGLPAALDTDDTAGIFERLARSVAQKLPA
ncbi:MAG: Mrp/NBP35 family ATP-binding protein [Alphaproteobacteria bacterium]|nr:Mrp/NBP35 family ATP-binding protein [Alphaproteobacteria bacterium]